MSKFKQLNANSVHPLFLHLKIEKRSHYLRTRSPQLNLYDVDKE
ncbi:hypothetical protein [Chroococcidiopsis sp. SAG 2025]|nr:hypothetical protein [Chroococcidiopsis sp. SAG 2025]